MNALMAFAAFLLPTLVWVYVARKVVAFSLKSGNHKAVSWLAGLGVGFLVAMCVLVLIVGLGTGGDEGSEMLGSSLSLLAVIAFFTWITTKASRSKEPASANWWIQVKQRASNAWRTAEEEVQRKKDAKAKGNAASFSMAMFSYVDVEGEWTERTVTDLGAYTEGGRQYVQGYCLDRSAVRTFRVDRIRGDVTVQPSGRRLSSASFFNALPYPNKGRG